MQKQRHAQTVLQLAATWLILWFAGAQAAAQSDPLPSWNDGVVKQGIIGFVEAVTTEGSADFVPEPERIATFDNDGTLWIEHPMYVQLAYTFDKIAEAAADHPEWKDTQPFKAALERDYSTIAAGGAKQLGQLLIATHSGMTSEEFAQSVTAWLQTARHPRFDRPYTELVYQPMLEVLDYLRDNGFQTYIVSGGGIAFMRQFTDRVYGIPPQQVIGSSGVLRFDLREGSPVLIREPQMFFVDDGPGKPVGIMNHIGRRPIIAFGNSDGDLEMLQWTTLAGNERRLGAIVHHTDAEREYAYDRNTTVGRLDKALEAAAVNQWLVIDMKRDWKVIFPSEN